MFLSVSLVMTKSVFDAFSIPPAFFFFLVIAVGKNVVSVFP